MGLRRNFEILRRRKWSILACGIVVGSVVGGVSALRTPTYSAGARVLLQPDDPAEMLNPPAGSGGSTNPDRYVTAQMDIVAGPDVAERAAAGIPGAEASKLRNSVSVRQIGGSDLIEITATSESRPRAAAIANAIARSYIEARRATAVGSLQRVIDGLEGQLVALQTRITDLDRQTRARTPSTAASEQLAAAATQYQALQNRQQELQINLGLQRGHAEIVAPASGADATASTSPVRDALLGGLLGLLLGVALAATREVLDERVRSSDEIERITGLPVLAELPLDQRSKQDRTRLAVFASPRCPLSEATRALRTSIELREPEHRRRSLLVTGAAAGEGKSLVSANLAAAYALAGYRTVLVDGDLRNPRLSAMFGTYPAPLLASGEAVHGLAGLLCELTVSGADRQQLEQAALLRTAIENLLFLPAGPEPANPSDLLDSRAMAVLLADLAGIADIVIIDAPPLLLASDAAELARRADAVVLVAAMGESHRNGLRRSRQMLAAHPRVLGVVANKVAGGVAYSPHRRATMPSPEPAPPLLSVVRRLQIPTPPTGCPDANGDIWIDLSDEADEAGTYDPRVNTGTLQVSNWGR